MILPLVPVKLNEPPLPVDKLHELLMKVQLIIEELVDCESIAPPLLPALQSSK